MYFDKIGNHITTVHEEEKRFVTVVVLFYDFFSSHRSIFSKMENFLCGLWYLEKIPFENTPLVQNNYAVKAKT